LKHLIEEIVRSSKGLPIIFPVHPRTAKNLAKLNLEFSNLYLASPLSYLEFNYLVKHAKAVITDSGGITEEATVMNVPCLTLRDSTERPETVEVGTNELLGTDPKAIAPALNKLFLGEWKKGSIPELWDGRTAERIVAHVIDLFK
jgi:UDP-N-acetylglucosamine 2-epimerase (non-hydrolysing)